LRHDADRFGCDRSDGDLGEQLVRNGLARIYGVKVVPPGAENARAEVAKLEQLEADARKEEIGGWGVAVGRLNEGAEKLAAFSLFKPRSDTAPSIPTPRARPSTEHVTGKIDINSATQEELEELPGLGPTLANEIIAARPFKSADDLRKLQGIGEKRYEKLRPFFHD
jgi:competence ComEA-like helix-hairpin-helix protein